MQAMRALEVIEAKHATLSHVMFDLVSIVRLTLGRIAYSRQAICIPPSMFCLFARAPTTDVLCLVRGHALIGICAVALIGTLGNRIMFLRSASAHCARGDYAPDVEASSWSFVQTGRRDS